MGKAQVKEGIILNEDEHEIKKSSLPPTHLWGTDGGMHCVGYCVKQRMNMKFRKSLRTAITFTDSLGRNF